MDHFQRFDDVRPESAYPPIATTERTSRHVSFVPTAEVGSTNANGGGQPLYRNKPYRADVRDSLEGTDSPGRLSICGIAGSANHGKIASMSCETGSFVTAICAPRKRAPDPRDRSGIFRIEKMSEEGICGIVKDDHRRQQVDRNV